MSNIKQPEKLKIQNDFWQLGDLVYVSSRNNHNYDKILKCTELNSYNYSENLIHSARFCLLDNPEYRNIHLSCTQRALDMVGVRISKSLNPEYFL